MIAMISGHTWLTREKFDELYVNDILRAIERGDKFIIGDAPGADTFAQELLAGHDYTDVVIYYWTGKFNQFRTPRNNVGNWQAVGIVGGGHWAKDKFMTALSDYDIAHVLNPKSGTADNLKRRLSKNAGT